MARDFSVEEQRKEYIDKITNDLSSTFKISCSWSGQKKELTIELIPVVSLPMAIYTNMLKAGLVAKKEYVFRVSSEKNKIIIVIKNK